VSAHYIKRALCEGTEKFSEERPLSGNARYRIGEGRIRFGGTMWVHVGPCGSHLLRRLSTFCLRGVQTDRRTRILVIAPPPPLPTIFFFLFFFGGGEVVALILRDHSQVERNQSCPCALTFQRADPLKKIVLIRTYFDTINSREVGPPLLCALSPVLGNTIPVLGMTLKRRSCVFW